MPLPRRRPAAVLGGRPWLCNKVRSFVNARVKWVRDRGLDLAVEKEKHLLPFHNLKTLLLSSSAASGAGATPSLPLSFIAARRDDLRLPFRATRFLRLFPSSFLEDSSSSSSSPHPRIRPSPALLRLHADESRTLAASRSDIADRLLRLLMLTPRRRLPLPIIDRLRWDLGLPHDYPRSLLPDYPDYFHLVPSHSSPSNLDLEVVCFRTDLAVSAMERSAARTAGGYRKGVPLAFPLSYPRGFDLEKKVRNWVDELQRLPYISPYESGSRLPPKSDFVEKWTVGMLHEILHLLIGKKTEKDNLAILAEHVGLPPSFRKVITQYPGIFYISNKLRTQTIVLREAYRKDLLVEKHPLMGLRYHYIHLMCKDNLISYGKRKGHKHKRASLISVKDDTDDGEDEKDDEEEEEEEEEDEDDDEGDISRASDAETNDEESDDEDADSSAVKESDLPQVP